MHKFKLSVLAVVCSAALAGCLSDNSRSTPVAQATPIPTETPQTSQPSSPPSTGTFNAKDALDRLIAADAEVAAKKQELNGKLLDVFYTAKAEIITTFQPSLHVAQDAYTAHYNALTSAEAVETLKTEEEVQAYLQTLKEKLDTKIDELTNALGEKIAEENKKLEELASGDTPPPTIFNAKDALDRLIAADAEVAAKKQELNGKLLDVFYTAKAEIITTFQPYLHIAQDAYQSYYNSLTHETAVETLKTEEEVQAYLQTLKEKLDTKIGQLTNALGEKIAEENKKLEDLASVNTSEPMTFNAKDALDRLIAADAEVAAKKQELDSKLLDVFSTAKDQISNKLQPYLHIAQDAYQSYYNSLTHETAVETLKTEEEVQAYLKTLKEKLDTKIDELTNALGEKIAEENKKLEELASGDTPPPTIFNAKATLEQLIDDDAELMGGVLDPDLVSEALQEIVNSVDEDSPIYTQMQTELDTLTQEYNALYIRYTQENKVDYLHSEEQVQLYVSQLKSLLQKTVYEFKQHLGNKLSELSKTPEDNANGSYTTDIVHRDSIAALKDNQFSNKLAEALQPVAGKEFIGMKFSIDRSQSNAEGKIVLVDSEDITLSSDNLNEFILLGNDQAPVKIKLADDTLGTDTRYFKTFNRNDFTAGHVTGWVAGGPASDEPTAILGSVRYGVANNSTLFVFGKLAEADKVAANAVYKGSAFYALKPGAAYYSAANAVTATINQDKTQIDIKIHDTMRDRTFEFGGHITGNTFAGVKHNIETKGGFFGEHANDMAGVFHVIEGDNKGANGVFGGSTNIK